MQEISQSAKKQHIKRIRYEMQAKKLEQKYSGTENAGVLRSKLRCLIKPEMIRTMERAAFFNPACFEISELFDWAGEALNMWFWAQDHL
jgi:hypothetical protein